MAARRAYRSGEWALSINESAAELMFGGGLPRPLENFAQSKYANLTTTIDSLTQTNPSHPRWTDMRPEHRLPASR